MMARIHSIAVALLATLLLAPPGSALANDLDGFASLAELTVSRQVRVDSELQVEDNLGITQLTMPGCTLALRTTLQGWGGTIMKRSEREIAFVTGWDQVQALPDPAKAALDDAAAAANPTIATLPPLPGEGPVQWDERRIGRDVAVHALLGETYVEWVEATLVRIVTLGDDPAPIGSTTSTVISLCEGEPPGDEPAFDRWSEQLVENGWESRLLSLRARVANDGDRDSLPREATAPFAIRAEDVLGLGDDTAEPATTNARADDLQLLAAAGRHVSFVRSQIPGLLALGPVTFTPGAPDAAAPSEPDLAEAMASGSRHSAAAPPTWLLWCAIAALAVSLVTLGARLQRIRKARAEHSG